MAPSPDATLSLSPLFLGRQSSPAPAVILLLWALLLSPLRSPPLSSPPLHMHSRCQPFSSSGGHPPPPWPPPPLSPPFIGRRSVSSSAVMPPHQCHTLLGSHSPRLCHPAFRGLLPRCHSPSSAGGHPLGRRPPLRSHPAVLGLPVPFVLADTPPPRRGPRLAVRVTCARPAPVGTGLRRRRLRPLGVRSVIRAERVGGAGRRLDPGVGPSSTGSVFPPVRIHLRYFFGWGFEESDSLPEVSGSSHIPEDALRGLGCGRPQAPSCPAPRGTVDRPGRPGSSHVEPGRDGRLWLQETARARLSATVRRLHRRRF